jgi:hypothetical protein
LKKKRKGSERGSERMKGSERGREERRGIGLGTSEMSRKTKRASSTLESPTKAIFTLLPSSTPIGPFSTDHLGEPSAFLKHGEGEKENEKEKEKEK